MNTVKTVIIDDEEDAISSLLYEIGELPEIEVVNTFIDLSAAENFLKSQSVDLVFLDIHMPEMNGISFLRKFTRRKFEVVYTTAHVEHAFEAYKNEIVGYLLKPVTVEDLKEILAKYQKHISEKEILKIYKESQLQQTLTIRSGGVDRVLKLKSIRYCQADGNYTSLYLVTGERIFVTKQIKYFEDLLNQQFLRIHKSYIINKDTIGYFDKKNGAVVLDNEAVIPVSRNKRKDLNNLFKK